MANPAERFFERPREWSRRKHEAFSGYLPQYTRILGKRRGRVYWIDGFAGAGRYGGGPGSVPGSPVLAAEISANLAGKYDLRCINVESKRRLFRDLSQNTASFGDSVSNRFGRFNDRIDEILAEIGASPALFFLDPFGVGGLDWPTLRKIGNRPPATATEMLINFNVPGFDRHAGWMDSEHPRMQTAFGALLDKVVGSEWRHVVDPSLAKDARYDSILKFYCSRIRDSFGMRTGTYPVRSLDGGRLKYCLIFATRNGTAMRIMSSVFYAIEKRYLEERAVFVKQSPLQATFFDLVPAASGIDEIEAERLAESEADVLLALRQQRRLTFEQIQLILMDKWFGRLVDKHYRKVCQRLIQKGKAFGPERGITLDTRISFVAGD